MRIVPLLAAGLAGAGLLALAGDAGARWTAPTEPALRAELLALLRQDQQERTAPAPAGPAGDRARTARLRQLVDTHGWPTRTMVGADGGEAAWVIAQHADTDVAFQQRALALLRAAADVGEAGRGDLAYLTDRVAANRGEPQTYGTQIGCPDGRPGPDPPLADPEGVDERRAGAGLPPLADYYAELGDSC